jgi:hypothetical protein
MRFGLFCRVGWDGKGYKGTRPRLNSLVLQVLDRFPITPEAIQIIYRRTKGNGSSMVVFFCLYCKSREKERSDQWRYVRYNDAFSGHNAAIRSASLHFKRKGSQLRAPLGLFKHDHF